jgi:hypothetical protein
MPGIPHEFPGFYPYTGVFVFTATFVPSSQPGLYLVPIDTKYKREQKYTTLTHAMLRIRVYPESHEHAHTFSADFDSLADDRSFAWVVETPSHTSIHGDVLFS